MSKDSHVRLLIDHAYVVGLVRGVEHALKLSLGAAGMEEMLQAHIDSMALEAPDDDPV